MPRPFEKTTLVDAVGRLRPGMKVLLQPGCADPTAQALEASPRAGTPDPWTWAALMRRVFALNALDCSRSGGRLRVIIVTAEAPLAVQALLAHRARSGAPAPPGPAPPSPAAVTESQRR